VPVIWPWLAMFQWAFRASDDPAAGQVKNCPKEGPEEYRDEKSGEQVDGKKSKEVSGFYEKPWARFVPFVLSAAFFLSRLFALFAPLPLLMLFAQKGRRWAWAAALSNGAIVALLGGKTGFLFYFVFVLSLSLSLPEMLFRKKSLIQSSVVALLTMGACVGVVAAVYSFGFHVHLMNELTQKITEWVDLFMKAMTANSTAIEPSEIEILKKSLILEFPSSVATFALILVWVNLVMLIRANPNKLCQRMGIEIAALRKWKAPEFLVWPVLVCGVFLLGDFGLASDVALNIFKFLMAVYVIQGLSIMSFFLELWNIRGFFRVASLVLPLVLSAPLVAGLGFFDLWFDFRSKFRQFPERK